METISYHRLSTGRVGRVGGWMYVWVADCVEEKGKGNNYVHSSREHFTATHRDYSHHFLRAFFLWSAQTILPSFPQENFPFRVQLAYSLHGTKSAIARAAAPRPYWHGQPQWVWPATPQLSSSPPNRGQRYEEWGIGRGGRYLMKHDHISRRYIVLLWLHTARSIHM